MTLRICLSLPAPRTGLQKWDTMLGFLCGFWGSKLRSTYLCGKHSMEPSSQPRPDQFLVRQKLVKNIFPSIHCVLMSGPIDFLHSRFTYIYTVLYTYIYMVQSCIRNICSSSSISVTYFSNQRTALRTFAEQPSVETGCTCGGHAHEHCVLALSCGNGAHCTRAFKNRRLFCQRSSSEPEC